MGIPTEAARARILQVHKTLYNVWGISFEVLRVHGCCQQFHCFSVLPLSLYSTCTTVSNASGGVGYVGFTHTVQHSGPCAPGFPTLDATQTRLCLQVLSKRLRLSGDFNFHAIAKLSPGFVGADLAALTKEAAAIAVTRIFQQLDGSPAASQQGPPVEGPVPAAAG